MSLFRRHPAPPPIQDTLFAQLEAWQGKRPWGHLLDAGTGEHSLRWILGLRTDRWTAVTGGASREQALRKNLGSHLRPGDRLCTGNWSDPDFLAGERFDTVLADYLLGAIDGFAPYFQDRLFARLRPHVAGRLYVVGLAPYPDDQPATDAEAADTVRAIARLRDACILLAGHRCYREYPRDWVERQLVRSGFVVREARSVPIHYRARWINGQLDVCMRKLPHIGDPVLVRALRGHIETMREEALATCERLDGLRFGEDWLVMAEPG